MAQLQSAHDLASELTGTAMLQGWDVLVAYREKEVNDILKARHDRILAKGSGKAQPEFTVSVSSLGQ